MKWLDLTLHNKQINKSLQSGDNLDFTGVYDDQGFNIDLRDKEGGVFLRFTARPDSGLSVLNSRSNGIWGTEQWAKAFPVKTGEWFHLKIKVEQQSFDIEVDNGKLCSYVYRGDVGAVVSVESSCALWLAPPVKDSDIANFRRNNWRSVIRPSGAAAYTDKLDTDVDGLQPGLSAIIRARNEEHNIKNAVTSVAPYVDEIIIVENASDDRTLVLAKELEVELNDVRLFQYPFVIPKVGEQHSTAVLRASSNTFARYNNWCLAKTSRFNFLDWDADFVCIGNNFAEMRDIYSLGTRGDNIALWFGGLELFQDGENYWINTDSIYTSQSAIVSKKHGCHWVNIPPSEELDQSYLYKANKIFYDKPVYYEIFRLDTDEFRDHGYLTDNVRAQKRMQYLQQYKELGKLPRNFVPVSGPEEAMEDACSEIKFPSKVKHYLFNHYSQVPAIVDKQTNEVEPGFNKAIASALLCIGVMTDRYDADRHRQLKSTWIQDCLDYGITYYFLVARPGLPTAIEDDVLYLDCPEGSTVLKLLAFYDYISKYTSFTHVFNIEDTALVNVDRIASVPYPGNDIVYGSFVSSQENSPQDASLSYGDSIFLSRRGVRDLLDNRGVIKQPGDKSFVESILQTRLDVLEHECGFAYLDSNDVLTHDKYLGNYLYLSNLATDAPWRTLWRAIRDETELLRDFKDHEVVSDWYEMGAFRKRIKVEEIEPEEEVLSASSA